MGRDGPLLCLRMLGWGAGSFAGAWSSLAIIHRGCEQRCEIYPQRSPPHSYDNIVLTIYKLRRRLPIKTTSVIIS